eukprot:11166519-Lingulodinium_polyedra.AAC.1
MARRGSAGRGRGRGRGRGTGFGKGNRFREADGPISLRWACRVWGADTKFILAAALAVDREFVCIYIYNEGSSSLLSLLSFFPVFGCPKTLHFARCWASG